MNKRIYFSEGVRKSMNNGLLVFTAFVLAIFLVTPGWI